MYIQCMCSSGWGYIAKVALNIYLAAKGHTYNIDLCGYSACRIVVGTYIHRVLAIDGQIQCTLQIILGVHTHLVHVSHVLPPHVHHARVIRVICSLPR